MLFSDFGLADSLLNAVTAEGYTTPTPIQEGAIPQIMAGRDLIGTAQTGTGKTAAFALPILHRLLTIPDNQNGYYKPRVLVLSPTRELATQIADSFQTYGAGSGLRHVTVYGGVSQVPQVKLLRRGVDIIIATPGRLLDLNNQGSLKLDSIEMFVLDEADRMLDMGFMPDIRRIMDQVPANRQTLLFSATMPPAIERLAGELLRNPADVRIAPKAATTDLVTQCVFHVERGDKPNALAAYLTTQPVERAVVFVRTKQAAERVAIRLSRAGLSADAIHGNKTQNARQRTLQAFRASRITVLVATDVAARGLDVDGVSHVINYDLPMEAETYVHRIGRTGRAGAFGIAMSFVDREQRSLLGAIERMLRKKIPVQSIDMSGNTTALALPSSTPSPAESDPKPRQAPPPHKDRPKGEYQGSKPRTTYAERVAADRAQGIGGGERHGNGERRSYGEGRPQGGRPSYGERPKYGERKTQGDRPKYGDRAQQGDRPQYGARPQGKRFGDKPKFVPRERTELPAGETQSTGDAPAPQQSERRFERRPPAGDRPRGRYEGQRPAQGERRPAQGDRRPAFGERRPAGPGGKFPPKRFEGQRSSFGQEKRPRRHDESAAILPPVSAVTTESREGSHAHQGSTGLPKKKAPFMKKKRHQAGNAGAANAGPATPRRYDTDAKE